jgi:hypothetical protein
VGASGRAASRPGVLRRQPLPGRRPASPLRLAQSGGDGFGTEVLLDLAAGSIGGGGSRARGPTAPSIHPSGATIEAPFPWSGAPLHLASHGVRFTDRILATDRLQDPLDRALPAGEGSPGAVRGAGQLPRRALPAAYRSSRDRCWDGSRPGLA